jgi:predicted nucleic acid-binding protein
MTSRLQTALSQGFAHQMLLQVRTVFAELASLRDRFHFEGMGDPEDSKLLATLLQQAEEAHETARSILMPKLISVVTKERLLQSIVNLHTNCGPMHRLKLLRSLKKNR